MRGSYTLLATEDYEMAETARYSSSGEPKDLKEALEADSEVVATTEVASQTGTIADEDNPFFVPDLVYTKEEEARVIRILDTRLFPWILLTTFVLNMDRTNNSNAISDNLPEDLGFTINVVNTATAIYSVLFSIACLSGAVIAKMAGPARCKRAPHDYFYLIIFWDRDSHPYVFLGSGYIGACTHLRQIRVYFRSVFVFAVPSSQSRRLTMPT